MYRKKNKNMFKIFNLDGELISVHETLSESKEADRFLYFPTKIVTPQEFSLD